MSSLPHPVPSRMSHNIAVLFGHEDDTLIAWQRACVQARCQATRVSSAWPNRTAMLWAMREGTGCGRLRIAKLLITRGEARGLAIGFLGRVASPFSCPLLSHKCYRESRKNIALVQ